MHFDGLSTFLQSEMTTIILCTEYDVSIVNEGIMQKFYFRIE